MEYQGKGKKDGGSAFGQEQPPLYIYIKRILERYPGGQIFKEIIQNADDAGARNVTFYLDNRTHGTESLIVPGLEMFQGPALLAYNDAKFNETDWDSIQKPEQSEKEKDPFKVGKFGLGFNSVYHITDLPTIISGPTLAFMEPQGKVWPGKAGRKYAITSPKMCSTLTPFDGISAFSTGMSTYPHTLFRFPLRLRASGLSERCYDISKLKELLEALKDEAQLLLIFLRSVTVVSVVEISASGSHNTLFEVGINDIDSERKLVSEKRQTFLQELKSSNLKVRKSVYRICYDAKFHVTIKDTVSGKALEKHWLVTAAVGSDKPEDLHAASKQKVLPWVGCALELDSETTDDSGGRIFCFLPLPHETRSPLPVHVNGTFGLNDNRRSLKWPSKERKHDSTAEWNMTIVKSLLPYSYALLIKCAIKENIPSHRVYNSWPQIEKLKRTPWSGLAQPLFEILFQSEVFWSKDNPEVDNGTWISLQNATIINFPEITTTVHKVLAACGLKLVDYRDYPHIRDAIRAGNKKVSELTPGLTRQCIRTQKGVKYQNLPPNAKHELLQYCLSDGKFNELEGLELLPLANGTFHAFSQVQLGNWCYVCNDRHRCALLPGLEHCLVDLSSSNLDLHKELLKVASSNKTQLQKLHPEIVAELISQCMPPAWKRKTIAPISGSAFSRGWFEIFWDWIARHNLDLFKDQMVLPAKKYCTQESELYIARLVNKSSVIFITEDCILVGNQSLGHGLEKFDVYFTGNTENLFPYMKYSMSLKQYVMSTSPNSILSAIGNAYGDKIHRIQRVVLTTEEAESIQRFLSDLDKPGNVLMHLPIFKCVNHKVLHSVASAAHESWNGKAVMITDNSTSEFESNADLLPPNLVVLCSTYHQKRLVYLFPDMVNRVHWVDFILHYLFPMILNNNYPTSKIECLMEEVLNQLPILPKNRKGSVLKEIKKIPFLRKDSAGALVTPCDLFDPSDRQLTALLQEDCFPKAPFNKPSLLPQLCQCGLRQTVTAHEIVKIIYSISSKSPTAVEVSRAKAVLDYLDSHQSLLESDVQYKSRNVQLKKALQDISEREKWLPQQSNPPEYYPTCLKWKGKSSPSLVCLDIKTLVCTQSSMKRDSLKVGSTMHIVHCPTSLTTVLRSKIGVHAVVEHLKGIIKCCDKLDKGDIDMVTDCIYEYLQKKKDSYSELKKNLPSNWIWIKKIHKFLSAKSVCLKQSPTLHHDLEPYSYVLPESMQQFSSLFKAMGVKECITNSQLLKVLASISKTQTESNEAWMTVMAILSSLTMHGKQSIEIKSGEILYVPIKSESDDLHLEDSRKVCYADFDFLQEFVVSKEEMNLTQTEDVYLLCHDDIRHLAPHLQLTPLSEYLDISEDLFEDFGQHEPLILRLKNILRDYKDGITIVKELIQNADDAEATEVNLCYDTRQHSVNPKTLLYSGMAECNGPALIVHNDAVFTDDDFQNITRLAAATKKDKRMKIGKFGVGFCSVYHITDIPSFVSREYLYIFDPTIQYLKEHIRDKSRPGKRLKFTQKIATFSNQLSAFVGLNGFQSKKPFKGTMFRFPFRTSGSEISPIQYTEHHIDQLLKDICESGPKLLLFLQSVKRITFSRIDEGDEKPSVLLEVYKEELPSLSTETQMLCVHTVHNSEETDCSHWLVGTHTEKVDFGGQQSDATSSVASRMKLSTEHTGSEPKAERFSVALLKGEVFCFLPLSLPSGLPVHVSANFAVRTDRTGIQSFSESSTGANEAEWNLDLMKDIIPRAYLNLLLCLSEMYTKEYVEEVYMYYDLWPLKKQLTVRNPWDYLIAPFYSLVSKNRLLWSSYIKSWLTLSESQFLTPNVLCTNRDEIPECVHNCVKILKLPVISLPHDYECHLPPHSSLQELDFVKVFFGRIRELQLHCDIRNDVIQFIMQAYLHGKQADLKRILQSNKCVPCTPNGMVLEHCNTMIDPRAFFGDLYEPSDGVFPTEEFQKPPINQALIELGMLSEFLHPERIVERAQTIEAIYCSNKSKALKRARIVLECISKYALQTLSFTQNIYYNKPPLCTHVEKLKAIRFLPAKQRPVNYPEFLIWKGDKCTILAPNEICYGDFTLLAGSQVCIVCTESPEHGGCGVIENRVITTLEMRTMPTFQEVVKHFCHVITVVTSKQETTVRDSTEDSFVQWVTDVCSKIYEFLEDCLRKNQSLDISALKNLPCVWTGSRFVHPHLVASSWTQNGPYLFQLPNNLTNKKHLVAALHIKIQFSETTFIETLNKIRSEYLDAKLDKTCQEFVAVLMVKLGLRMEGSKVTDRRSLTCYLPDNEFVMKKASTLNYNDAKWCKDDESTVHSSVPRDVAIKLGVQPVRAKLLDEYEDNYYGEEFGQTEELTQRIKNILEEYPLDITVLKELLQNADDAKSTKMFIILDKRTHGMEALPSDEWKDLQGPALLVWNDSVFHEEDLQGIQKLGLGNKRSESDTIGMYGIGFNVVYHLTDCPSFISTEKDGKSTLCVLDPHCRYIPGAKKLKPGRRFNNLDHKFWQQWFDLRSAYLQDHTLELPEEMRYGSLFRFPLRHSQELIANSQLVIEPRIPINAQNMEENLMKWAPDMRETLFFLNNVTELQFFVIDDNKVSQIKHFKIEIDAKGQKSRARMQERVHSFNKSTPSPHVESYTLTLIETTEGYRKRKPVEWLIQQGVGDLQKPEQTWLYLPRMKPKHGIAAPLCASERSDMRVFCFLPLPIKSNLPVHINGSFVLHSSRRQLWQPTSRYIDDKAKWNKNLMEAIASSYAHLLVELQDIFISPSKKETRSELLKCIELYYRTFPVWLPQCGYVPEGECLDLAKMVYNKLYQENSFILVHLEEDTCVVKFLPLINNVKPEDQPYFIDSENEVFKNEVLLTIFRKIGMQITEAPMWLYEHFLDLQKKLYMITRQSVYAYYSQFHSQILSYSDNPEITDTKFGSVQKFKLFTKYVCHEMELQFPDNIPLLLTADCHLRKFDVHNKAIRTEFSELFSESKKRFLHPELMDVPYKKDYFLKPSPKHWGIVSEIMSCTLPDLLKCVLVSDASSHIRHNILTQIWKCLSEEEFFLVHHKTILQTWALIPSTKNELFSLNCSFLPIIEFTDVPPARSDIFYILEKLRMPVVDLNIVQQYLAEQFCPQVSNPAAIVENLFNLHRVRKVFDDTGTLMAVVKQLLEYCGTIHLSIDIKSLSRVKSLPLFKNIDNTFCAIPNGAYIWPGKVCEEGKNTWLQGHGCVFLDAQGDWKHLKASEALGIRNISAFKIYSKFIFPMFSKLTEQQRLHHLKKIKDELFNTAEQLHILEDVDAEEFITCLKTLSFIPYKETLRPVCDFADPEKKIFKVFAHHFQFPPSTFDSENWLPFLRKIGLRTSITTKEYLQFCFEVNLGKNSDVKSASRALIDYLFQEKDWHNDMHFLEKVSRIAFVCSEPLPSISWICNCASPEVIHRDNDNHAVHLTSLTKAVDYEHHKLMWTVKPVVHLPSIPDPFYYHSKQRRTTLLQSLKVSKVTAEGVVQNIQNISKTKFSDFRNFETYSCGKPPKDGISLLDVLNENYAYLMAHHRHHSSLSPLKDIPCIPVCAEGNIDEVTRPVLVRPIQVIALSNDLICEFRPFLSRLPNKFYSILPGLLAKIGVEQSVMLKHIQGALEAIQNYTDGQELDVNTQATVKNLICKLYELLHNQPKSVDSIQGKVLYLPNSKYILVDSTTLLYQDSEHFKKKTLDFKASQFSELHLLVMRREVFSFYKFHEKDLCNLLPPELAPKPLTTSCKEVMSSRSQIEAFPSSLAQGLSRACKLPNLTAGACAILKHNSNPPELCEKLKVSLDIFFKNCEIYTVTNLVVDLWLGIEAIGTAEVDFHIEKKTNATFCLYVDKNARKIFFFETLSMAILSLAAEMSGCNLKSIKEPKAALHYLLRADSSDEIRSTLREIGVKEDVSTGVSDDTMEDFDPRLNPELGSRLPDSWHHRLLQDYNNIFRPGEWVGYEVEEDCIVFASIGYKIDNGEDFAQYFIYLEEGELEGRVVNILDIYKIHRTAVQNQGRVNTQELTVYEGGREEPCEETREEPTSSSLTDIKKEICEELKRVWKLSEDMKKKAIRRMYLKWHPDKNMDNPTLAEEAFKFLKQQIERLEQGKPMSDPEEQEEESTSQNFTSQFWEFFYRRWDNTARNHYHYQKREQRWDYDRRSHFEFNFNATSPDVGKAKIWIRQAECDYKALSILMEQCCSEVCGNICFLAHEVVEKSLKAGMLAIWGLRAKDFTNHKKMKDFALNLEEKFPGMELQSHVLALPTEVFYYKTRWPNKYDPHDTVPADHFDEHKAIEAMSHAHAVLDMIKPIIMN